MALKFLFVGKANAEIERLNAELLKVTKERDDAVTALESNSAEVTKQAEDLQGQVTALQSQVSALEASAKVVSAELATTKAELQAAQARIANPPAEIVKIASAKAAEITGAQGQPPVTTTPAASPASDKKEAAGLFGLAKVQAAFKTELSKTK